MKKWYKLDNVGKFYAATRNSEVPKVFRYSVILKNAVDPTILQEALDKTVSVFTNFNVNLKKGLFWYYFEETGRKYKVSKDHYPICFRIYNNSDDFLYRVTYYNKKIIFEVSHILSDGRGSIEFFKLLVSNYCNIKYNLKLETNKDNKSFSEKTEDSFNKYYKKTKMPISDKKNVYIYKGRKLRNQTRYMECHLSTKKVLDLAHKYNTTLSGLLISILIYSFKDELKVSELKKHIKIDIPVDLRQFFNSYSSMNFFGITSVSYKFVNKDDNLEDIIKEVNKQLSTNVDKERLLKRVNFMVSFEKNWLCKVVPINLKNLIIKVGRLFASYSTTSLSNVGIVKFDSCVEKYIDRIGVLTSTDGFQFTICSLGDDLSIGISSRYVNNDVIKNFCRYFSINNISVLIDSNGVE